LSGNSSYVVDNSGGGRLILLLPLKDDQARMANVLPVHASVLADVAAQILQGLAICKADKRPPTEKL